MKKIVYLVLPWLAVGCVSGPPALTMSQAERMDSIEMHEEGVIISRKYTEIEKILGVSCANTYGSRTHGNVKDALYQLKRKAASLNADAVVGYTCGKGA
ncbi:MAG: hypothetical protein R3282_02815, partial [Rhodothermales bacterium]|nr:hypothetical protein [Rhodothermales bacterium]